MTTTRSPFSLDPIPPQQPTAFATNVNDKYARECEQILSDHPSFRQYFSTHPKSVNDAYSALRAYEAALEVAEREIKRDNIRSGITRSKHDNDFLVAMRAEEIAIEQIALDDAIAVAEAAGCEQAYQSYKHNVASAFQASQTSIGSSMKDIMSAHPFLVGFFGSHLISKFFK